MLPEVRDVYQFGAYRISVAERVLRRDGEIVPLTPKAFDTLLVLARSAGSVVSKEAIMRAVWPDAFVEEGNLSQNIFTLRKVLGQRPDGGQHIETIPKRGYRLVFPTGTGAGEIAGAAELAEAAAALPGGTPAAQATSTYFRRAAWRTPALASACFLVAITLAAARWAVAPAGQWGVGAKLTPLTVPNDLSFAVISPDGAQVAYVSVEVAGQSVWVRGTGEVGAGAKLVGPLDGHFWGVSYSPDGKFLYYTYDDNTHPSHGTLFRIAAGGGEPQKLLSMISNAAVSPDGGRVVFKRYYPNAPSELITARADGTGLKKIATSDAGHAFHAFQWAADGTGIDYAEGQHSAQGEKWSLLEIPAGGGPPRVLDGPRPEALHSVVWLNRAEALALIQDRNTARSQVWHLSPGRPPQRLTNDTADYTLLSLTGDGRKLLANTTETHDSIWMGPAPGLGGLPPQKMALPTGSYNDPAWLPDGRVVYVTQSNLWLASTDDARGRPLLPEKAEVVQPAASADGKFLVFVQHAGGFRDLWRVGLDGSGLRRLTTSQYAFDPATSAGGKWVLYASNILGQRTLWRVPVDGSGPPSKLVNSGCGQIDVSPDGNRFTCVNDDGQIEIRAFESGMLERRLASIPYPSALHWDADGKTVLFLDDGAAKQYWAAPVEGGKARKVGAPLPSDLIAPRWSSDNQRLVYLRREVKVDLSLISNYR